MIMTDHSENYYQIIETISNPQINFMMIQPLPEQRQQAIKQVLHEFVNHQYLAHELTEEEANDLHQYINERSYDNA